MASWNRIGELAAWISFLSQELDKRNRWRLGPMLMGALWATGRRTVARWITAANLSHDWQRYYAFLWTVGRKAEAISRQLLRLAVRIIPVEHLGQFIRLAIDDTPTARYGPHVVGAGVHRDPTPGPSGNKHLYGHIWVMLSWVVRHPNWGPIGLPIRSLMYIRRLTFQTPAMRLEKPWKFRTKLELAAELVEWAAWWFSWLKRRLLVVADGAYAKRPFLDRMRAINAVVVSRLRKDAALFDLPPQKKRGQRGRPRTYGVNRLSLSRKAAHRHGWLTGVFQLYGRSIEKTYKTFLATYPPARGVIRVVLVKEDDGWIAFFSTDPTLTVQEILEAVADRGTIEQNFHDLKEVQGAGEQQVRNIWVNLAVWHITTWLTTLIELWAWNQPATDLVDREERPWDDLQRRPSHADKRNAMRRAQLRAEFLATPTRGVAARKIRAVLQKLMSLVA
jgi:hypothetical protein